MMLDKFVPYLKVFEDRLNKIKSVFEEVFGIEPSEFTYWDSVGVLEATYMEKKKVKEVENDPNFKRILQVLRVFGKVKNLSEDADVVVSLEVKEAKEILPKEATKEPLIDIIENGIDISYYIEREGSVYRVMMKLYVEEKQL